MCGNGVPVIDGSYCQGVPSDSRGRLGLLEPQLMSSGSGDTCPRGKLVSFNVELCIEYLVDNYHVAWTSAVVEAGDIQMTELVSVRIGKFMPVASINQFLPWYKLAGIN